jgi:hypothetical protein
MCWSSLEARPPAHRHDRAIPPDVALQKKGSAGRAKGVGGAVQHAGVELNAQSGAVLSTAVPRRLDWAPAVTSKMTRCVAPCDPPTFGVPPPLTH